MGRIIFLIQSGTRILFIVAILLLFSDVSICSAQSTYSSSGKKITWHDRGGSDRATGGLEIFAEPVTADVYLDGKLAGSTPLTLEKVATGKYEIRIKANGYSDYRTYIEIIHDQFSVVTAKLSRAHHIAWKQSRTAAIQSSLFFPGKGQVDLGYTRGWTYLFGFAATGWYSYYQFHKNEDERDKFNAAQNSYSVADNPVIASREYNRMMDARENMFSHQQNYENAWIVMGGIWALNMIDVMYFAGREPVIEPYGFNIKITPELKPTKFTLKLCF